MRTVIIICFISLALTGYGQWTSSLTTDNLTGMSWRSLPATPSVKIEKIKPASGATRWRFTRNHAWTGGLVLLAGAAKGFNETLQFHWKEFKRQFPRANPQWFNPAISYRNKYKNHNSQDGPRFFLSTSVLVMATDQYHLNNFINRACWGTALVIKLGEKKKPFKHYLLDLLYYSACHQAGFAATYYPFVKEKGK